MPYEIWHKLSVSTRMRTLCWWSPPWAKQPMPSKKLWPTSANTMVNLAWRLCMKSSLTTTASFKACSMATPTRDLMKTSLDSSSSFGRSCKRPTRPTTTNMTRPCATANSFQPASSTNISANVTSQHVGSMPDNMSSPRTMPTTAPPTLIGMKQDSESAS